MHMVGFGVMMVLLSGHKINKTVRDCQRLARCSDTWEIFKAERIFNFKSITKPLEEQEKMF